MTHISKGYSNPTEISTLKHTHTQARPTYAFLSPNLYLLEV